MDKDKDPTDQQISVVHILEKRKNGEVILLDSAAFDAAGTITDPQCKDIAVRLIPHLPYDEVKKDLFLAVERKRAELMAKAKQLVSRKMLAACQNKKVTLMSGVLVNRIDLLRAYFKEATTVEQQLTIDDITQGCFDQNNIWKDDMDHEIKEEFGIDYDPATIKKHVNGKGTGFIKKIITKALCNLRQDLRQASARAQPYLAVSPMRIKRSHEDSYFDGKYQRKKKVSGAFSGKNILIKNFHSNFVS